MTKTASEFLKDPNYVWTIDALCHCCWKELKVKTRMLSCCSWICPECYNGTTKHPTKEFLEHWGKIVMGTVGENKNNIIWFLKQGKFWPEIEKYIEKLKSIN